MNIKMFLIYIHELINQIEMKRFIIILIALTGAAIGADAQTASEDRMYFAGDRFYMNGIPLNDGEMISLIGEDAYNNEYLSARKKLRTSNTLGYIGGTLMGTGLGLALGNAISTLAYGGDFQARPYIVCGGITVAGLIPTIIHLHLNKAGKETFMRIAERYNEQTGKVMELTLSPAESGFGIALNF